MVWWWWRRRHSPTKISTNVTIQHHHHHQFLWTCLKLSHGVLFSSSRNFSPNSTKWEKIGRRLPFYVGNRTKKIEKKDFNITTKPNTQHRRKSLFSGEHFYLFFLYPTLLRHSRNCPKRPLLLFLLATYVTVIGVFLLHYFYLQLQRPFRHTMLYQVDNADCY